MNNLIRKFGFSLVPLFVVGAAAELGLRSAGWPQITEAFEHNEPFWLSDPNLRNKALDHKEERTSFQVSTNVDGLRTAGAVSEKASDAFRVMTLGCSTTFGWGVADAETYPAQLQKLLHDAGYTKVEVINGGQPGYTSFQGRWLWEESLHKYEPDVVLLGFVVQDARKAAYSDKSQAILQGDNRFMKDHVLYNSRVYLALRDLIGTVQVQAKERPEGGKGGVYRVPPEDYVDNLRTLAGAVQDQGAQPVLFGYPLEREGYTEVHRKILKAAAKELAIPYLELQSRMDKASRGESLYFQNDRGHANAQGNARIASWAFEFLVEHDLLGAKG
ncbi:MAG: hypothetical protein CL930_03025 [Deltaproteobacteria bacterium]|nr:hypothetical protein [Deltaproteobacteria bacterium]